MSEDNDAGRLHDNPELARELEASLREIGIPPRPQILEQIMGEARAEDPDFNHISELISRDVGLAAGLIKTANSPFYGYGHKAHSVREALLMLGLISAASTVAGLILRRVFPAPPQLERFWDASDQTAQLSGWLVQELGIRYGIRADDAFTFGLFRDCGIPIMLRRFPNYHDVLKIANADAERLFTEVEESFLPTNHALVGSLMAQSWWLPEMTSQAIRQHHDLAAMTTYLNDLSGASRRLIALAQVAEKFIQDRTGLNRTREWDKLGETCLTSLDLDDQELASLARESGAFIDGIEPLF